MTQSEQEKRDMNKDGSSASALTIRHYLMFFILSWRGVLDTTLCDKVCQ
jgi:hypothetical protein